MPPRRPWRDPCQDHSSYVQQLFKDFIERNSRKLGRPDYQQQQQHHHQHREPVRNVSAPRRRLGIFDRAVYARFERETNGGNGYVRNESATAPKSDLMRWIDQQRQRRQEEELARKPRKPEEYINLPGDFFSGVERMKLPFEQREKSIGNVTNNFVPPATSTPFERLNRESLGITAILSDPDDFAADERIAENVELDNFFKESALVVVTGDDEEDANIVEANRKELQAQLKESERDEQEQRSLPSYLDSFDRKSWTDHSLISNQNYYRDRATANVDNNQHRPSANRGVDESFEGPPAKRSADVERVFKRPDVTFALPSVCPRSHYQHRPSANRGVDESFEGPPAKRSADVERVFKRPDVTFTLPSVFPRPHRSNDDSEWLLSASPPSPKRNTIYQDSFLEGPSFLQEHPDPDETLIAQIDSLLECEQSAFDFEIVPPRSRHHRALLDFNADTGDDPLYLTQDVFNQGDQSYATLF